MKINKEIKMHKLASMSKISWRCKLTSALAAMPILVVAADASFEWSGGDATLGGGKVQILCNGSGEVTSVVAKPTGGDTLTLTGQSMTFAAGATITVAADDGVIAGGKLVFANDVLASGALALSRTDGAYAVYSNTASPIIGDTWRTVVSGGVTSVSDWEVVSLYGSSENGNPAATWHSGPYHLISHDSSVTTSGARNTGCSCLTDSGRGINVRHPPV